MKTLRAFFMLIALTAATMTPALSNADVEADPQPGYEQPEHEAPYRAPRHDEWHRPERPPRPEYSKSYGSDDQRLRFNVGLLYDFSGTGYSNNATVITGNATGAGPLSVDMDGAPGLSAEIFSAPEFGWGFSAGLTYELARNINDLNNVLTTVFYTGSKPSMQFTTLYGNAVVRWGTLYVPFGINYTIPSFNGGSNNGALTNASVTGGVGFQFGVGFLLGEHASLELEDRIIHYRASGTTTNVSVDWGDVYQSGLLLALKYSFN